MNRDDPSKDLDPQTPKIMEVIKSKLFLIIAGSMLLLAVGGGIYALVLVNNETPDQTAAGEAEEDSGANDSEVVEIAEVLPQERRDSEDGEHDEDGSWTAFDSSIDPFADPMELTGTVTGGRGGTMAIIESSGTSYIVAEGDYVDDLWSVRYIDAAQAILRAHDKEVTLHLDKPPETRSLSGNRDEADQEGDQ